MYADKNIVKAITSANTINLKATLDQMHPEQIEVIAYSGYKGNQYPKSFRHKGWSYEVLEIEKEWVEYCVDENTKKYYFKVRAKVGSCKISYNPKRDTWFLEQIKS